MEPEHLTGLDPAKANSSGLTATLNEVHDWLLPTGPEPEIAEVVYGAGLMAHLAPWLFGDFTTWTDRSEDYHSRYRHLALRASTPWCSRLVVRTAARRAKLGWHSLFGNSPRQPSCLRAAKFSQHFSPASRLPLFVVALAPSRSHTEALPKKSMATEMNAFVAVADCVSGQSTRFQMSGLGGPFTLVAAFELSTEGRRPFPQRTKRAVSARAMTYCTFITTGIIPAELP
jgi:hypothetical protein